MSVLPSVLLLTLCLMGPAATAQSRPSPRPGSARPIELTPEPTSEEPEVFIGPGVSTMFSFDTELLRTGEGREAVELEPRAAIMFVDAGLTTLKLVPSDALKAGDRVRMRVRFKDGAAPTGASFTLVVSATRAERVVDVYRDARPAESYQREASEARAETARCLDELARTRAERSGPEGLMGLLANNQVDKHGVKSRDLTETLAYAPGSALVLRKTWSYRSVMLVAVELVVRVPRGEQPWATEEALLVGKRGREPQALVFWQSGPVTDDANENQRVIVGVKVGPDELQGTYSLKLWDAGRKRTVTFNNVVFP